MAYQDSIKGKALALLTVNRGNVKKTALALGIPRQTLNRWARGQYVGPDALRCKREAEEQLAKSFEQKALDCLDAITPDKFDKSSLRDLTWAAAVSVDKMRLLREQPALPTTEIEKTLATALLRAAEAMVEMARLAGRTLALEEAQESIRRLQLRQSQITIIASD